ncbi:MAG: hypothetical protein Q8O92_06715 [Candidatus Latescibacter sp.]|nr:hypothetical protein [Candidatus Latescibacter sp.]
MLPNIDRYKKDIDSLLAMGEQLHLAMQRECFPEGLESAVKKNFGDKAKDILKGLPSFTETYQSWYSEAKVLVRQMLPDRLSDFVRHYEKPKPRKDITYENYRIEDYLQGLNVTRGWEKVKVVGPDAAIPHFRQQLAILKSVKVRFESSLFDIRQLVQADLFDSELDAARELAKHKFTRAAGALAGVVLERHLAQVCDNHGIKVTKKAPGIADLNNALKDSDVIDVPQWRFLQHLADIRNLCDHNKKSEPTAEQVDDLVAGIMKVTKTLF